MNLFALHSPSMLRSNFCLYRGGPGKQGSGRWPMTINWLPKSARSSFGFHHWAGIQRLRVGNNPKLRLRRSTPYYGVRLRSCRFGFSHELAHRIAVAIRGDGSFQGRAVQAPRTGRRNSRTNAWRTLSCARTQVLCPSRAYHALRQGAQPVNLPIISCPGSRDVPHTGATRGVNRMRDMEFCCHCAF